MVRGHFTLYLTAKFYTNQVIGQTSIIESPRDTYKSANLLQLEDFNSDSNSNPNSSSNSSSSSKRGTVLLEGALGASIYQLEKGAGELRRKKRRKKRYYCKAKECNASFIIIGALLIYTQTKAKLKEPLYSIYYKLLK